VSADAFRRQLAVPMHAELTDAEVERVVTTVREATLALS
jgi:dTDP-4-amino-4,6-dideoxygalactose transaminase